MITQVLRKWMLLLIGNVLSLALLAQGGASISGTVVDKNTQQVIAGATLKLQPGNKTTLSDGL
ncbi:MAG TPA: hypothetical protein VLL95_10645 [Phnomibacter sp.]|nr:hypothetical protein [Phnomibacter sp.]